ncbi:peptidylprolyl isomerase [Gulosibacter molinativorax]|uniref:peptidylprolyl isomerase n=2 Tax=Gulosibacter molinativorax TaxID=256821 RepID=A0ABT7C779_9MICO|nr:peptidylprolyl isomerase [Gulosibacter molinativorax]QUY61409.1 Putative peptidyl-prolyl cis-trans isomerase B [Gulosibacter molinativorax]
MVVNDVQKDRRRRDNRIGIIALVAVAVLAVGAQLGFSFTGGSTSVADPTTTPTEAVPTDPAQAEPTGTPPAPAIAEDREWTGTMTLNDIPLGITIDGENAPQAAANFIDLSQTGFYDNVGCHRLTTEGIFVLQCGDPTGTGTGGPGYQFGPLENVPADGVYPAGTIAMARAQAEDSQGSQFFIVYEDTQLPAPGYTVFGQVTSGLDELKTAVIDAGVDPTTSGSTMDGTPMVPVQITDITLQ